VKLKKAAAGMFKACEKMSKVTKDTLTALLEGMLRGMEGVYTGVCSFLRK
jgi:hypothetical protein